MMPLIKRAALSLAAQPVVGRLFGAFGPSRCAVLMLHRFAGERGSARGHDPVILRATLASLRKSGVAFEYVDDVVARVREGAPCSSKGRLSVAITVDDGYADLLDVEHIFAEFDCPVTGYVVPDVINGNVWFWWDQIDWVCRNAVGTRLDLAELGDGSEFCWHDQASRLAEQDRLGERLKLVPNAVRLECLRQISAQLDVPLPSRPPAEYRVLTWDELRAAESRGIRFGAHTMSHPILRWCSDAEVGYEVGASIEHVRAELANPSLVFCYPNGRSIDFGVRETTLVASVGMRGAVSAEPGLVVASQAPSAHAEWAFQLPRFVLDDRHGAVQRSLFPPS
jgi:peptidoglycan/xylan/chitin deacetylase (PgdA/CDA1 family)